MVPRPLAFPLVLVLKVIRRLLLWLRLLTLYFYSPAALARIARNHHLEAVRYRAWVLSGAFTTGKQAYFNGVVDVVVGNWGRLAATLGERVALAPGVTFVAASGPCYSRLAELEGFTDRYIKYAPITVKDDTWIGANVTVLPGVTIGKCCLVGACSLVTKDVPDYAIVVGAPARVVGDVRDAAKAK